MLGANPGGPPMPPRTLSVRLSRLSNGRHRCVPRRPLPASLSMSLWSTMTALPEPYLFLIPTFTSPLSSLHYPRRGAQAYQHLEALDANRVRPPINEIYEEEVGLDDVGSEYCDPKMKPKLFLDPLYKHIELEPYLIAIIDTPEFQRLRNLRQLGACSYVYAGASHSRFQHSIGVSHLAGSLVRRLRVVQPELNVTDADLACVEIAALCHDLGHGPFSHVYETYVGEMNPTARFSHEEMSLKLFDQLVERNNIDIARYGLGPEDVSFIKELIVGGPLSEEEIHSRSNTKVGVGDSEDEDQVRKRPGRKIRRTRSGRGPEKAWLYEIVNNKLSGLDVDKLDYYLRDSHSAGITVTNEFSYLLKSARVCRDQKRRALHLCYPEKAIQTVIDVFSTRFKLHKRLYQHAKVKQVELMLIDALALADPYMLFNSSLSQAQALQHDGRRLTKGMRLSESFLDANLFSKLDDGIFTLLTHANDPRLLPAQQLLGRIHRRELYKLAGECEIDARRSGIPTHQLAKHIEKQILDLPSNCLRPDQFKVHISHMHYGKGKSNPVDGVLFYRKGAPNDQTFASRLPLSKYKDELPRQFEVFKLRVYCLEPNPHAGRVVRSALEEWCEMHRQDYATSPIHPSKPIPSTLSSLEAGLMMLSTSSDEKKSRGQV